MDDRVKEPTEWEVGDMMIIAHGGWGGVRKVVPIVRLTKTRVTVKDGHGERHFTRRQWGREIGSGEWSRVSLQYATPSAIAAIVEERKRDALLRRIDAVDFKKLTTEQLDAIVRALPAAEPSHD